MQDVVLSHVIPVAIAFMRQRGVAVDANEFALALKLTPGPRASSGGGAMSDVPMNMAGKCRYIAEKSKTNSTTPCGKTVVPGTEWCVQCQYKTKGGGLQKPASGARGGPKAQPAGASLGQAYGAPYGAPYGGTPALYGAPAPYGGAPAPYGAPPAASSAIAARQLTMIDPKQKISAIDGTQWVVAQRPDGVFKIIGKGISHGGSSRVVALDDADVPIAATMGFPIEQGLINERSIPDSKPYIFPSAHAPPTPPAGYPGAPTPPAGYPGAPTPPAGYPGAPTPPAGYPGAPTPPAGYPGAPTPPAGYPNYPGAAAPPADYPGTAAPGGPPAPSAASTAEAIPGLTPPAGWQHRTNGHSEGAISAMIPPPAGYPPSAMHAVSPAAVTDVKATGTPTSTPASGAIGGPTPAPPGTALPNLAGLKSS